VTVVIDDAPYVVTRITDDPNHGFILRLNDESEELLDPTTLFIGQDNVLYCRVKGGEHTARFLRPAYYQLAAHIQEAGKSETFFLQLGDTAYPISISSQ